MSNVLFKKPECLGHCVKENDTCNTCAVFPICVYVTDGEKPPMKMKKFVALLIRLGWYTREEIISLMQNAYSLKHQAARMRYEAGREQLVEDGYTIHRFLKRNGGRGQMYAILKEDPSEISTDNLDEEEVNVEDTGR